VDYQPALAGRLRHVALNVTSVVTTTGFALGDYSLWGNFSLMLFSIWGLSAVAPARPPADQDLSFSGRLHPAQGPTFNQLIHRGHDQQKYKRSSSRRRIVRSILTFSFFFAITICVIALALSHAGRGLDDALTGAGQHRLRRRPGAG